MFMHVQIVWIAAQVRFRVMRAHDEQGSVVEKVILTAVFAALAIAVGAIIVAKVTAKAHSINLNN
jgi:cell division protein FtsL